MQFTVKNKATDATFNPTTLTAISGAQEYLYEKDDVSFSNGEFYRVTVKMNKTVHLNLLTTNYTAEDEDILTGTCGTVTISDPSKVTQN